MILSVTRCAGLPLRLRRRLGKLCSWFLLRPNAGMPYKITGPAGHYAGILGNHMDNKIYLYGCHEAASIRLIRDILTRQAAKGSQPPVYMDIGTNAGLHLCAAATHPDCRAAYGFEPYAPVRKKAETNLTLNDVDIHDNNATTYLFPFGLSDQDAQLDYYPPQTDNLGTGSFIAANAGKTINHPPLTLEVRQGDQIVHDHDIRPSLIKIDVEGFEKFVFQGLIKTIATYHPTIIFEYEARTRQSDPESLLTIRKILGESYRLYGICRSREFPKLVPFQDHKQYENILAVSTHSEKHSL